MTRKIVILIFLALVIRITSIFILGRHINPEVWEYDTIALNILAGNGYIYKYLNNICYFFGSSPLYAYFEALIHWLTNKNYIILEIIQAIVASLSVIPLFHIASRIFNEKTATISGILYCFHPGLIVYTTKIHELTLVVFVTLMIISFLVYFKNKWWNLILAGALTGFGILLRPTIIFIIPSFLIYLLARKRCFREAMLKSIVLLLLAILVISPWIYRGYKIYHRFIFITTTSAEHFWRGNNPVASGTALTKDNSSILSRADKTFKRKLFSLNEIEQYDFFKSEAIEYIKKNPTIFLRNTAKKFIYFWSFSPQAGLTYPLNWLIVYKLLYCFLALFFIIGLYSIFVNKSKMGNIDFKLIIFLFAFSAMVSLSQSLFYVEMRHRWMLEPLLLMFSARGVYSLWKLCCLKARECKLTYLDNENA